MADDGPAEVRAELLQHVERARDSVGLIDSIVRIPYTGVAVVIESVAVPGIASGFCDGVHETRARASVSGVVGIVSDLKFLNGLLAEDVGHAGSAASVAEIITGGVRTVHGEGIGAVAVGKAGIAAALLAGHADQAEISVGIGIGSKQHKVCVAAAAEREIRD
jgi:hypothetical protein